MSAENIPLLEPQITSIREVHWQDILARGRPCSALTALTPAMLVVVINLLVNGTNSHPLRGRLFRKMYQITRCKVSIKEYQREAEK